MSQPHSFTFQLPIKQSLVDLAYDSIVEAIVDQRFSPGERLNIDLLARQLEVSNTPVREALGRIKVTGLIQQTSNRGFTVAPQLTKKQYQDLFEVRHLLEVESLRQTTIPKTTLDNLAEIAEHIQHLDYGTTYRAFKELLDSDDLFHRTLIEESNNRFLIESWSNLYFYLHISRLHVHQGAFTDEDFEHSKDDHVELVKLLREKQQEKAVQLLSQHIRRSKYRLIQLMDDEPETDA